jgi:hypothetical protein
MVIKSNDGAEQHLVQNQFNVFGDGEDCFTDYYAKLSLAHSTSLINNSFVDSIIAEEQEPIAVVTYDR